MGKALAELARLDPDPLGKAPAELARVDPDALGKALAEAARVDPVALGKALAEAARVDPVALRKALAEAARVDPVALGKALAEAARVDPDALGKALAEAARVDPDALGKALAEAARVDPVALGKALAEAARVDPVALGKALAEAARVDPDALGKALAEAARVDPDALGKALAEAARVDPDALGDALLAAARVDPDALGKALAEAARVDPDALGKALAEAARVDPDALGDALLAAARVDPDALGDALVAAARVDPDALGHALADAARVDPDALVDAGLNPDALGDALADAARVSLENGLTLDAGGGISGLGLGVKGPVQLSDQVVFNLRGAAGVGYLRLVVGEEYTGTTWRPPSNDPSEPVVASQQLPIPSFRTSGRYNAARIEAIAEFPFGSGVIPSTLYTTNSSAPTSLRFSPYSLTLETESPITSSYQWSALLPGLDPPAVASATTANVHDDLLQLPVLPDRVSELARQITEGKDTDFQRLEAIRQHLLTNYTYDLENTAPPPGQDGVDYFLFEDRRGVCASFSSAFVVLARTIGIPARTVGGWAVSPTADLQPVRAFQAHQWAEVPFDGLGWVTFDATPGGPKSRVVPTASDGASDTPTESPDSPDTGDTDGGQPGGADDAQARDPDSAATAPAPLIFVETLTEITDISQTRILKGSSVFVSGTVTDLTGAPLDGMRIEIFLNETKEHGGDLKGTGTSNQGAFSIPIEIDSSVPAGNYQVLAHSLIYAVENTVYQDSWSDPPITVYTPTQVNIQQTETIYAREPVIVTGTLLEAVGDLPIVDATLRLEQNGVPLGSVATDGQGQFSQRLVFNSPGIHFLRVVYSGSEFYQSLEFTEEFSIWVTTEIHTRHARPCHS